MSVAPEEDPVGGGLHPGQTAPDDALEPAGGTPGRRRHCRLVEIAVVAAAVAIAAASARTFACSANDSSRFATVECLVDYHTLAIDRSIWFEQTCDKIRPRPDGPFYSDKPPVMALMMAVPYLALHDAFGLRAAEHKEIFCYLLTLATSGLAYVAAVWCLYRLGRRVGLSPGWAAVLTASFGLATLALVYTRHVNSNLPTLAAVLAVLLNLAALARPTAPGWTLGRLLLIGALAGFAYALEQPTGGLLLAAGAVAAAVRLRRPSAVVWVALAALPWMALHHAVTYGYAGTLGPANADPAYFNYPGSQFDAHNLTGRWNHAGPGAFAVYAFLMLFGTRGFVLSNPTLLLALPAALWALMTGPDPCVAGAGVFGSPGLDSTKLSRNKPLRYGERDVVSVDTGASEDSSPGHTSQCPCAGESSRIETLCFGLWGLAVWLLYAALSNNFGGTCCSIRWFVPLLAPAYYWLALLLRDAPTFRLNFILLSGWGAVLAGYFWIYGPFGVFYDEQTCPYFPYFFWSVQAAVFLTWSIRRAAVATAAAPRR